jgi:hypothetical protein
MNVGICNISYIYKVPWRHEKTDSLLSDDNCGKDEQYASTGLNDQTPPAPKP